MPKLDFYACGLDFEPILDFIFLRSGCRIFESYSAFDAEIREFKSAADLLQACRVGECAADYPSILLQLVPPRADSLYSIRRIKLKPSTGHTHRYAINGWGLIQLHLGGFGPSGLVHSHTNHNSEKRAHLWAGTYPDLGSPKAWDWKQVVRTSSALNRHVRTKLSVTVELGRPVLPKAAKALGNGTTAVL